MKIFKSLIFISLLFNALVSFAASVDHLEVDFSKQEANSGESVDLTITAVDENGNVVKDYTGNIVGFSETDSEVTLPEELASDEGYTFTLSDEGVVKFENSVSFIATGEQELGIYDTDSTRNIVGLGKININAKTQVETDVSINITSPENNLTIGTNSITVSGESRKNHQILIVLNDKDESNTTTDSNGIFEKNISGLENGDNILQAYILDSDNNKIGESTKTIIKVESNQPSFKKITLSPLTEDGSIEEGKNIVTNVFATAGLTEVNLVINDTVIKLEETEDGVYTGNFNAPNGGDTYKIDLMMKDALGHSVTETNIAQINVTKVELAAAQEETSTGTLDISGLKLVTLKNKSILTWNKLENVEGYHVYKKTDNNNLELVSTVSDPIFEIEITGDEVKHEYFAVKAFTKTASGEVYEGNLSEATKIQTGPEMIILMLLSLLIGLGVIIIKRKRI